MLGEMAPSIAFSFKEQAVQRMWKFLSGYNSTGWTRTKPSASKMGIQEDTKKLS